MSTKHCCTNCHFLIKHSEQLSLQPWTNEDRSDLFPRIRIPPEELKYDKFSRRASAYDMKIGCYKQIWTDEHNEFRNDSKWYRYDLRDKVTESRKNRCFFVGYHEGMDMDNAEKLFDVQHVTAQNNRKIMWTQITSGVAILVSLLALGWQIYEAMFFSSAAPPP